jgi:hypothetical protein
MILKCDQIQVYLNTERRQTVTYWEFQWYLDRNIMLHHNKMGLIVADDLILQNGMTLNDYYINIDDIRILKSNIDDFKYTISANVNYYVNKTAREGQKTSVRIHNVVISTDTLTDIQSKLYEELKKSFTNFTDDL